MNPEHEDLVDQQQTIVHLNEYCLLEIFSLIDLTDLCSLAETCAHFKSIAGRVIPKQLKFSTSRNGESEIKLENFRKLWNSLETRPQILRDVKRIFTNFGWLLTELLIFCSSSFDDAHIAEYFMLNLAAIHCNTLKRFEIHVDRFKGLNIALKPFVNNGLQRLALTNVCLDGSKSHGVHSGSLVELKVDWVCDGGAILENYYPKLASFTYAAAIVATADLTSDEETSFETLSTFILRHPTLKKLHLSFDCDEQCAGRIVKVICSSCKDVSDLKIYLYEIDLAVTALQPLQTLHRLTTLKLFGVQFHDFKLLAGLAGLLDLSLLFCRLPIDSNQFSSLAQLVKLKLSSCYSPGELDVTKVVTHLTNLNNLHISDLENRSNQSIFELEEATFSRIVSIVRERRNVLTMKCKFNFFNFKTCAGSQMVRLLATD